MADADIEAELWESDENRVNNMRAGSVEKSKSCAVKKLW